MKTSSFSAARGSEPSSSASAFDHGRLDGKIALITGVGAGIGAVAAARFAAQGARVVGCDIDQTTAERTEKAVRADGGEIRVMGGVDLGDPEQARDWVDRAVDTFGGIDVLYNNASTQRFGALDELGVDDWDFTIRNELNLVYYTPERLRRVVLDRIPLRRHGRPDDVVNAAIYLASDESAWVSGAHLVVDGGGSVLG